MTDDVLEKKRTKIASRCRQRAICQTLNIESIRQFLWEADEAVAEVAYAQQDEDVLTEVLGGEEEAFSFRMAFSVLEADIQKFSDDLDELWVPQDFDDFLVGMRAEDQMLGYDESEGDYFGFDENWQMDAAVQDAKIRLKRHTKDDLLDAAGQCVRIAACYMGLKVRYDNLRDALDLVRDNNANVLQVTDEINKAYDKIISECFPPHKDVMAFERMVDTLPQECWLR